MARQDVRFDIVAQNRTQKAFSSVQSSLKSLRTGVASTTTRFAKIGAAAAAAAAVGAAAFIKMRMDAVDNLAKTADKLGVTTEAIAGFRHAADLSGVSAEAFDKALQGMGVQIQNAAKGTGLAVRALDDLGLNALALSKLPLDQQMMQVADAMQNVESKTERVRIAYELFGARGVSVLNMMNDGAEGLREMAKEADMLGISMNRVDLAMIEEANDQISRAQTVFAGFGNQISVALSPVIAELAGNFYQTALDANETGNVGQRVARALVKGFGFFADGLLGIKILIKGLQLVFYKLGEVAIKVFAKILEVVDKAIDAYNKVAEFFGRETIKFKPGEALLGLGNEFADVAQGIKEEISSMLNGPLPSDSVMQWFDDVQLKARETAEIVAASVQGEGADGVPIKKLSMIEKAKMEGAEKLADFEKMTAEEKTKHVMEQMDTELGAVAKNSKKLFAIQKAMQIGQAIMNTYTAATKALASYPPPLGAIFAGIAIASGMAQVASIRAQSFEGGGFTGRGARAGGLDGKGGYMAMVHPNESVIDHTKGQSGGVTIINNIDASGAGPEVDIKIEQAMNRSSAMTVAKIQDLMSRRRFA